MHTYIESFNCNDNFISFNQYKVYEIPYLAIQNYIFNNRENIYFLILAIFQLLTWEYINILPQNWSPSGPFSTTIPLVVCFFLEILGLLFRFISQYKKTYTYNYKNKVKKCNYKNANYEMITIPVKNIKKGDLIFIEKEQVIPVDCLCFYSLEEDISKINYSNLNGEPDIIIKQTITKKTNFEKIDSIKVLDIKSYPDSIKRFNAKIIYNKNRYINIDHEFFIPGGAINKGCNIIVLVTEVGKNIRSYTSVKNENIFTYNFLDNKIAKTLKFQFIPLLILYIFVVNFLSFKDRHNIKFISVIEKVIQSWIILNGIVPFSAKLILLYNRNIQSLIYSRNSREYMKSDIIDNIPYTKHLICDKTGTITKNKLLLKYFTYNKDNKRILSNVLDLKTLPFIANLLILSINVRMNIFSTTEDKILAEKIYLLGYIFSQKDNIVTIYHNNKSTEKSFFTIIDNKSLLFNSERKLSSVIFKDSKNVYIISKGPIKKIRTLLKVDELSLIDKDTYLLNNAAHLRSIAVAYKKIDYNRSKKPEYYEVSKGYEYITTLGIEDELQENVNSTILNLKKTHKVSICTGDRKETALEIAKISGIYNDYLIELNSETKNEKYNFAFSGNDISEVTKSLEKLELFKKRLFNCSGFIGYSLIPQHKKFIANLFESSNISICAIGDGNNDIPMLKTSTIAISMDNKINNNVVSSSDIRITGFKELKEIFNQSQIFLNTNKLAIYLIFYKTMLINTVLLLWIIRNNQDLTIILFDFLQIQGFHLIWGLMPILTSSLYTHRTKLDFGYIKYIAPVTGILTALLLNNYMPNKESLLISTVFMINLNFLYLYGINKINISTIILGLILFFIYVFTSGYIIP